MAWKIMPPSTRRQDHGRASSYLLARSHVTYSNERCEDNTLPVGTPQDALDCAADLYLGDPTA
jgi:hypothetical protein